MEKGYVSVLFLGTYDSEELIFFRTYLPKNCDALYSKKLFVVWCELDGDNPKCLAKLLMNKNLKSLCFHPLLVVL